MEKFEIKPYTKKQLALMYFPESMPRTAVKHLMKWVHHCTPLCDELLAIGYRATNKGFTPRQVGAIVKHLGEP